ncbi:DUF6644 family protein [Variovorax sp. 22077]|uniref:DUF6644 family protein n=1 Tax=Variovorax sp. 22077 TaxID=3453867 RepID=UPI003F8392DD
MSPEHLITWLYQSPLSTMIRDVLWIVPLVQSIHILAIAVIFGSAVVSDLRLAGVLATDEPLDAVVRRYYPWMRNALIVLLATGLIMTVGEPDRVLKNTTFWLKMALVVGVFSLTWLIRRPLLRRTADAHNALSPPLVKPAAWVSILLWSAVIFCGRWIAYTI